MMSKHIFKPESDTNLMSCHTPLTPDKLLLHYMFQRTKKDSLQKRRGIGQLFFSFFPLRYSPSAISTSRENVLKQTEKENKIEGE